MSSTSSSTDTFPIRGWLHDELGEVLPEEQRPDITVNLQVVENLSKTPRWNHKIELAVCSQGVEYNQAIIRTYHNTQDKSTTLIEPEEKHDGCHCM